MQATTTPATAGKTVTATIFFRLSPTGQKAALLAGVNAAELQSITGPINAEDLDLCRIAPDGTVLCATYQIWAATAPKALDAQRKTRWSNSDNKHVLDDFPWGNTLHTIPTELKFHAPPVSAGELMREVRADVAAIQERARVDAEARAQQEKQRRAEQEKIREQAIARVTAELAADPEAIPAIDGDYLEPYKWVNNRRLSEHPLGIELQRRKDAAEQRKLDAQALVEQAKAEAIAAFVARSGDALLQEQFAAELLCRKTVIRQMANAALDAAGLPEECPDSVVCANRDCPCKDNAVDCIPPFVYARWKAIGPLPEDSSVEFREVRDCLKDDDDRDQYGSDDEETAGPTEYQAVVTIPSGPFRFTRRIKV